MGAPFFTLLNGQIRTPLRFYREGIAPFWDGGCIDESEPCEYAVWTSRTKVPPFQAWAPLTDNNVTVASWILRPRNGGADIDMSDYLGELDIVKFEAHYYVVHYGLAFGGLLPVEPLYAIITMTDGEVFTSELFEPRCTLLGEPLTIDFGQLCSWTISDSSFVAQGFLTVAGPPAGSGQAGEQWINIRDGNVYTWGGSSWLVSPYSDGDYYYVISECGWYEFNSATTWENMGPAAPWYAVEDGLCFSGDNPDNLSLITDYTYANIPEAPGTGIITVTITNSTTGSVIIGDELITGNGTFEVVTYFGAGSISITPVSGFDGCLSDLSFRRYRDTCHLQLNWTNCGNVGNTYYEEGFVNTFFIPRESAPSRPTPTIQLETTENGRKDLIDNFRRKQTEWVMEINAVPWYVADALSDIPLHDTITLTLQDSMGTETLQNVRVEVTWDDASQRCYASIAIYFQVADAAVVTNCCNEFEPLCPGIGMEASIVSSNYWDMTGSNFLFAADAVIDSGEPTVSVPTNSYVLNLADETLYFWDGATWSLETADPDSIWWVAGQGFYQFSDTIEGETQDDEWVLMQDNAPVIWDSSGVCITESAWTMSESTEVVLTTNLDTTISAGALVRVRIYTNASGSGYVSLGGTFSTFSGTGPQTFDVTLVSSASTISVTFDEPFVGCVLSFQICELID